MPVCFVGAFQCAWLLRMFAAGPESYMKESLAEAHGKMWRFSRSLWFWPVNLLVGWEIDRGDIYWGEPILGPNWPRKMAALYSGEITSPYRSSFTSVA